jgi:hypothetical protein
MKLAVVEATSLYTGEMAMGQKQGAPSALERTNRATAGLASLLLAGAASLALSGPAHATLTITPTFDSSITSLSGAAAVEGAINSAIGAVESNITSPHNISVAILFQSVNSGLGQSQTVLFNVGYSSFRSAFAAVATQPNQLTALASLPNTANNPVTNNANLSVTSAEGRNLGFNTPASVTVGGNFFDTVIGLNTSATFPPNMPTGSNFGLQAVANHEIDEALGIGGTGSTVGGTGFFLNNPGDLDIYRYTAAGARTYTTAGDDAFFSINGGTTDLVQFNQAGGGSDFGDWHTSGTPRVQDAFATAGANPALGPDEITAFNVIGYDVVPAPLIGHGVPAVLGLGVFLLGVKLWGWRKKTGAVGLALTS